MDPRLVTVFIISHSYHLVINVAFTTASNTCYSW